MKKMSARIEFIDNPPELKNLVTDCPVCGEETTGKPIAFSLEDPYSGIIIKTREPIDGAECHGCTAEILDEQTSLSLDQSCIEVLPEDSPLRSLLERRIHLITMRSLSSPQES